MGSTEVTLPRCIDRTLILELKIQGKYDEANKLLSVFYANKRAERQQDAIEYDRDYRIKQKFLLNKRLING